MKISVSLQWKKYHHNNMNEREHLNDTNMRRIYQLYSQTAILWNDLKMCLTTR